MNELKVEEFLEDVKNHEMTVIRDDGLYRHLRFKQPKTNNMYFDILTWPGHLCYTGDMGTYVFCRVEDMFNFFRRNPKIESEIQVNPRYWGEKCLAADGSHGITEYSEDVFENRVREWVEDMEVSEELMQAIEEEVILRSDEGEDSAMRAALEFEFEGKSIFQDFWECNLRTYTFSYLWCCYALCWAVNMYDESKAKAA